MAVAITAAPNLSVSNYSVSLTGDSNHTVTTTWEIPQALVDEENNKRATYFEHDFTFYTSDMVRRSYHRTEELSINTTTASINLNSDYVYGQQISRNTFYPATDLKLEGLGVSVEPRNAVGQGKVSVTTLFFKPPKAPTISEITFDTTNGHCNATITAVEGTSYEELKDIYYRVTVKTRTGSTVISSEGSSESSEFTVTYDASDYLNLGYDQFIKVTVQAWARGYAGDSETVSRSYYLSYPAKATITSTSVSAKDPTGKLTVGVKTNQTAQHPVDKVTLEYIANTTFENASSVIGTWTDAGIEDDGDCTALAMPVENLIPDRGKYTWIRVKTVHAHEGVLVRYSEYVRLKEIETPPAEAVESVIKIISAVSGEGGESAVVQLAWDSAGTDDSIGTELTWSDEENAWKSTKEPDKYEFTWSDGTYTSGGTTYHGSAKITIKGLSEGKTYYIKARRYYDGDTITYGRYSNTTTVVTSEKPTGVVANCSKYVAEGASLPVYWTLSGSGLQTEWQILAKQSISQSFTGDGSNKEFTVSSEVASVTSVKVNGTATSAYTRSGQTFTMNSAPANNATVLITYESYSVVVAKGDGSIGSTQISAQRLKSFATENSLTFIVQVSTGSGFVSSEPKTVTIISNPTLSLTANATITAQPYSFTASSSRLCDLIIIVTSQGASGQWPQGVMTQINGDTIYSDVISPAWSSGSASITLPTGLDFWDGGNYTLSVIAVDRETGLRSNEAIKNIKVAWTNKAKYPKGFVTLTAIDQVTEGGEHVQGVRIALTPPTSSSSTDVYDIYRMDGDRAHLIGEGFPRTYTAVDKYAPFTDNGELYYRVALRTVDGAVSFADVSYTLVGEKKSIRLDWQGGSLELPYGTSIGDSYKKNVEFRQHMDGSVDGYWNQNVERTSSFSSSVIKLIQPNEISLARQLARYAGAVFVRTSNGSAFTADVQVNDLSVKNLEVTAIAIDATEVELTEEFMLPKPIQENN